MAGKYHVDGDVLLAPLEMLHPWIKKSILFFTELAEVPKVILSPCGTVVPYQRMPSGRGAYAKQNRTRLQEQNYQWS
jgi:hypothetical protein